MDTGRVVDQLDQCADELSRAANALLELAALLRLSSSASTSEPAREFDPSESDSATLTIREAAAVLGISESGAYRLIQTTGSLGPVPVIRVGRRMFVGRRILMLAIDDPAVTRLR